VATVRERRPRRVLDIGCGAGLQLVSMLRAAPEAVGVGLDADGDAAALAERTLARSGLAGRGTVRNADVREAAGTGALGEPFDLALLANLVYYVPRDERVALLRTVGGLLAPGGVLLVVTTVATPQLVSRHFDLLLRAQEGAMELPDAAELVEQLAAAGLRPEAPVTIAPGSPLVAVRATVPA
jgi:cyclopropane fatty-acyl-phospholipid synthase-like methyltransferase